MNVSWENGGTKSQSFWKTIKHFQSKKSGPDDTGIILLENDKVITDEGNICKFFNDYYVNITENIGIENEEDDVAQHPEGLNSRRESVH